MFQYFIKINYVEIMIRNYDLGMYKNPKAFRNVKKYEKIFELQEESTHFLGILLQVAIQHTCATPLNFMQLVTT